MSASFTASSHNYLSRPTAPLTAPPFTMACWARPTFAGNSGGNQGAVSIANSSTGFSQWSLGVDGTPEWWIRRDEASSNLDELDVATAIVANTWQFALAQITAANNVRLYVWNADGTVSSDQSTNSRSPSGVNSMVIGSPGDGSEINNSTFDGLIAEAWVAGIDVWPGGNAAPDWFIRWIAMNGPFARPDIAQAIVEYRGLRNTLTGWDSDDTFSRGPRPTWTNINGVTRNAHPPLILPRTRQTLRNRPARTQEDLLNLWVSAGGTPPPPVAIPIMWIGS